ncbi:MAG: YdeI/OmpD-associated family protein [Acidimicrobiia bacterium]|nr:YdeI/OmpD-associated family protein [Acidimicrobiia bacterium]
MTDDSTPRLEITTADELRSWLDANHATDGSVWLVTYKKHVTERYVSVSEILDELLCFGWIDGVRRKLDEDRTMQLISPRRTQHWAKTYKDRAARLIDEQRMHAAGLASIAESKRLGLWDFMDDVDALIIPEDLEVALRAQSEAFDYFDGAADSYKRNVLRWIKLAKTPPTRAKRIAQTAELSSQGRRVPQM